MSDAAKTSRTVPQDPLRKRAGGFTGLQVLGITAIVILITAGATYWFVRTYVLPADFEPVVLTAREEVQLDTKLRALGIERPKPAVAAGRGSTRAKRETSEEWLRAEPYSEDPSMREIRLDERELNALVAHNTDLARRLAIDLSDDLASARLLIHVDPDFPIWGGRALRVAAGLEVAYRDERPVIIVRGVSLMGVPIPNAWLGNMKNVDLVKEFGGGPGLWQAFSDGIEFAHVEEGRLVIKLNE